MQLNGMVTLVFWVTLIGANIECYLMLRRQSPVCFMLASDIYTHWLNDVSIEGPGGRFKNTYELLNLRALKISKLHKNHIFQCMG